MSTPRALFAVAELLIAGIAAASFSTVTDAHAQNITNGTDAPDDISVVALVYGDGVLRCTGTLISSHVVLTAAHCLYYETPAKVVFVDSMGAVMIELPVAQTIQHPAFDPDTYANDIGTVILADAAPDNIPRIPLAPPGALVEGVELRLVGFGRTSALADDSGVRRQGTAVIDSVDPSVFLYRPSPSQACIGDSGGPAFTTIDGVEYLLGLTSHGDPYCDDFTVNTRVDAYIDGFVQPLLDCVSEQLVDGTPDEADLCALDNKSGCSATSVGGSGFPGLLLVLLLVARIRGFRDQFRNAPSTPILPGPSST